MDLSELNRLEQRNEIAGILRRAKALIDTEDKWFGPVTHQGPNCALTAINNISGKSLGRDNPIYKALMRAMPGASSVAMWNNTHTHAEVMAAFDRAIALAEQQ